MSSSPPKSNGNGGRNVFNPIAWMLSAVAAMAALIAGTIGVTEMGPWILDDKNTTQARGIVAFFVAVVLGIALNWHSFLELLVTIEYGNIVAALIGIAGYIYDHSKTISDERRNAQRERIVDQTHKLLIPVTNQYHSVWLCLAYFINEQQTNGYPPSQEEIDLCEEITKRNLFHPLFEVPSRFHSFLPFFYAQGIAFNLKELLKLEPGESIFAVHHLVSIGCELPPSLHKALLECDRPNSRLWKDWESFVRHELYPAVKSVAEIIHEYADLMEPLTAEMLKARFGTTGTGFGHTWMGAPRGWFYSQWLAYTRSWDRTIAQWDEGDYNRVRCNHDHPIGMFIFNLFAQQKLSKMEADLVGSSQMTGHAK